MSTTMYCFVGDLLGFRNLIRNTSGTERSKRIDQWLGLVQEATKKFNVENFQLVSDTIFAATPPTVDGLRQILSFAKHLLQEGMRVSLPIRGGIARGDLTWTDQIAFGTAIVDAFEIETQQEWIGVSCQPQLPGLETMWDVDLVVVYTAPMKSGPIASRPVVAWEIPKYEDLVKLTLGEGLSSKGEVLGWSWAQKVQNTAMFSHYLTLLRDRVLAGDARPEIFYGSLPMQVIDLEFRAKRT